MMVHTSGKDGSVSSMVVESPSVTITFDKNLSILEIKSELVLRDSITIPIAHEDVKKLLENGAVSINIEPPKESMS